ncbi:MAG: molybdate ABC transporter substrate-binding protein [Ktedonobacteraceae bacterium]
MKKYALPLLFLLLSALLLASCGTSPANGTTSTSAPVTLNVFAASSLTDSFNTIAMKYQQLHPNVTIKPVYNGSPTLEQQIANGAPADIFASADTINMQKASQAGLVGLSQIFVRNRLVVILPTSNPAHIATLKDLARSGVKIDLAAPVVPVGNYARQVIAKMAASSDYGPTYQSAVLTNIVSQEENVKAVVQKVELGEADAGIVYVTDVTPADSSQVTEITIPDQFNIIAEYPIAVVKTSPHQSEAQSFLQYVLSTAGQAILKQDHFIPVSQ